MRLEFLDFDFSEAKKTTGQPQPQNINTNIDLIHVSVENGTMALDFSYSVNYAPGGSYIRMNGKASFSGPETKAAFEEWKKTKRISGTIGEQIINVINYSASLNAVFIARVFNLTPPIIPPTIKLEDVNQNSKSRK